MGMNGPGLTPTVEPEKPATWKVGGATILSFVALLYLIETWDYFHNQELNADGIQPWRVDGLWGILWAPLLHSGWDHLNGNAPFALVLGFLMTLIGMSRFIYATAMVWILGGLGTWLIGNIGSATETNHIGASGLIFGWLTFLIVFGFFTRKAWQIVVGVVVLFIYGGILWGALPGTYGVSWQGHLCGGIAGVFAAYVLAGPERKARALRKSGSAPRLTV
jgi:membrane associated rhomboid family serine protease